MLELGLTADQSLSLSRILQHTYHGRYDAIQLEQHLKLCQNTLHQPLSHKGPDSQTQNYLKQNQHKFKLPQVSQLLQLDDQSIDFISKFSAATELNQMYVVGYLRQAMILKAIEDKQNSKLSETQSKKLTKSMNW